jgi:hypothetical protein
MRKAHDGLVGARLMREARYDETKSPLALLDHHDDVGARRALDVEAALKPRIQMNANGIEG